MNLKAINWDGNVFVFSFTVYKDQEEYDIIDPKGEYLGSITARSVDRFAKTDDGYDNDVLLALIEDVKNY